MNEKTQETYETMFFEAMHSKTTVIFNEHVQKLQETVLMNSPAGFG